MNNKYLAIALIFSLLINVYLVIGITIANKNLHNCDDNQMNSIPCKDRVIMNITYWPLYFLFE